VPVWLEVLIQGGSEKSDDAIVFHTLLDKYSMSFHHSKLLNQRRRKSQLILAVS